MVPNKSSSYERRLERALTGLEQSRWLRAFQRMLLTVAAFGGANMALSVASYALHR